MPPKSAIKHPHVAWRDGRPRFQPGPKLRAEGYKGRDLRHDDGRWFSRGECVDWSQRFERERRARKPAKTAPAAAPKRPPFYSVAQMFEDFWRSAKFDATQPDAYSPATVADYKHRASLIERDHPLIWNAPVHLLDSPTLTVMFDELRSKPREGRDEVGRKVALPARGLAQARQAVIVLSAAIGWAISRGKIRQWRRRTDNPALGLDMPTLPHRIRFATRAELAALIAAADAMGRSEIADMAVLAVWTGQRQADRLLLANRAMLNGRRVFRQQKTGAIVAIRDVPELRARMEAAAQRRAAPRATALLAASTPQEREEVERRFSHAVLDETRWVPFLASHYQHTFADVRDLAIAGDEKRGLKPCPSLAGFHDQDFRDTSVTWQGLAGATIPEIIAVTGHSAESATRILKHYLARHPEMADSAIGKMLDWYDAGGETEIGL